MDRRFVVPELLYKKLCGCIPGLEYWGGGANVVLTWPHFGHGENFDANTVPQLPQNAPPLVPPDDWDLLGVPHDGQEDEAGDSIALQLVQVSDTTNFKFNLR